MLHALGTTLLHSLWQISLIFLIYKVLSWIFYHQNLLLYRFNVAALLLSALCTFFTFQQEYALQMVASTHQEISVNDVEAPLITQLLVNERVKNIPMQSASFLETLQNGTSPYVSMLGWMWCLGALFFGIRLVGGYLMVCRLKTQGISSPPSELLSLSAQWCKTLKINTSVRILLSSHISEPLTIGFWKPIVLFPAGMLLQLSPAALEVLLLHELAHIRRYDYIVNIGQLVLETLFFYHPLFWMLSKEARARREYACDDVVKKHSANPLLYAQTLTNLQMSFLNHQTQFAMHATGDGSFPARIMRIMGVSPKRALRLNWMILCVLPVLGIFIVQSNILQAKDGLVSLSESLETTLTMPGSSAPAAVVPQISEKVDSLIITVEPLLFRVGEESEIQLRVISRKNDELVVRLESASDGTIKINGNGSYSIKFNQEGIAKIYVYRKESGREFYIGNHAVRVVKERIQGKSSIETADDPSIESTPVPTSTPNVAIEPLKMNVLYIGVDNPLNIGVSGYVCEEMTAKIIGNGASLKSMSNCQYIATVTMPGDVSVEIYVKRGGVEQRIGSRQFRVKRIPDPSPTLQGFRGNTMTKEELLKRKSLSTTLSNFDFDGSCEVVGYEVNVLPKQQNVITLKVSGAEFSPALLNIINNLEGDGDVIFFDEIRVKCSGDTAARNIGGMSIKLVKKTE